MILWLHLLIPLAEPTYPIRQADETSTGGLKENRLPEGYTVEPELAEGNVKLQVPLCDRFDLVAETLERLLQFLSGK